MSSSKLVRDKIPEHISRSGRMPVTHAAHPDEYWTKLKEKLLEEAGEFSADETIEEFADVLEVLDAIADYKKFDRAAIEKIKAAKAEAKGKFTGRIILEN